MRVAAPYGLSSVRDLNQPFGGSSANGIELMTDRLAMHVEVVSRVDRRVYLRRRPDSTHTTEELAKSLRSPGLLQTSVDEHGMLIAEFADAPSAAVLTEGGGNGFATGPYVLEDEAPDLSWIRLRSRGEARVDVIELVSVDGGEQWRRIQAHAIDVVPFSPRVSLPTYENMSSIRTVLYPATGYVGLHLNTSRPALADAAVRQRLAATLDRRAVAAVACGAADCAADTPVPTNIDASLPAELVLIVLGSDSIADDAARAMRLQLEDAGVAITLDRLDMDELGRRAISGEYDLLVAPLYGGSKVLKFFHGGSPFNLSGWSSPEFDAAADRGDVADAWRVMAEEVPALPLFWDRQFAAVDSRFCGGKPDEYSWRWLADVYPCDEGAEP